MFFAYFLSFLSVKLLTICLLFLLPQTFVSMILSCLYLKESKKLITKKNKTFDSRLFVNNID